MKFCKGFMLIEAVFGLILTGTSMVLLKSVADRELNIKSAKSLGEDIGGIISAIDKRILLDGAYLDSGWDAEWIGVRSVKEGVLAGELIGFDNSDCRISGRWSPILDANSKDRLISCHLIEDLSAFSSFDADSVRRGDEQGRIKEWSLTFFPLSEGDFESLFAYYGEIIKSASESSVFRKTGVHKYSYVHRLTNDEVSKSECYEIGIDCGIKAAYSRDFSIGSGDGHYIRVSGEDAVEGSLFFNTVAEEATCYAEVDGRQESVECGVRLDDVSTLQVNEVNTQGVQIINGSATSPVYCTERSADGEQNTKRVCGITLVGESNNSVSVEAHVNRAISNELRVMGGVGDAFLATEVGDVTVSDRAHFKGGAKTHGNLELRGASNTVGGTLRAQRNIHVDNLMMGNALNIANNLTVGEELRVHSGDIDKDANIDKVLTVFGETTAKVVKVDEFEGGDLTVSNLNGEQALTRTLGINNRHSVGASCDASEGRLTYSSSGLTLNCVNGVFTEVSGLNPELFCRWGWSSYC